MEKAASGKPEYMPNPKENRDEIRQKYIDFLASIGIETAEFTFQELAQPLDSKKVSAEITNLTGITNEEAYAARPIWEVFPDFAKFIGNDILVGYNCKEFDCKMLVRAGRYSNLIIKNKYFDVMRYAMQMKEKLGILKNPSLGMLAKKFGVINPKAHRALADAVTTAKVFLKLKEMDDGDHNESIEDILADLDKW